MAVVNPLFQDVKDNNVDRVRNDLIMIYSRNERDEQGNTPLHYARSVAVARLLLHPDFLNYDVINPININAVNNLGYTPLMMAAHQGQTDVGIYLINEGADVNVFGNDGRTARSILIGGELLERLVEEGAAVGEQNLQWVELLGINEEGEEDFGAEVMGPEVPEAPPAPAAVVPHAGEKNVPWGEEDPVTGERIRNGNAIVNWGNSRPPPGGPGKFYHKTTYNAMLHSGRPMVSPITRAPIVIPRQYTARLKDPHGNVNTSLFSKGGRRHRSRTGRKSTGRTCRKSKSKSKSRSGRKSMRRGRRLRV